MYFVGAYSNHYYQGKLVCRSKCMFNIRHVQVRQPPTSLVDVASLCSRKINLTVSPLINRVEIETNRFVMHGWRDSRLCAFEIVLHVIRATIITNKTARYLRIKVIES